MMTGQILGGSPVAEAAHYQILIIYLISTCRFATIFMNVYIVYRVAFDGGSHVLRTDRFIEVVKNKGGKDTQKVDVAFVAACQRTKIVICNYFNAMRRFVRFIFCCSGILRRHQWVNENGVAVNTIESNKTTDPETTDLLKEQDLSADYGTSVNNIQILSNQHGNDTINANSSFFHIAKLQFSTPKSHTKKHSHAAKISTSQSSVPSSPSIQSSTQQQRKLCTNLNANLAMGKYHVFRVED